MKIIKGLTAFILLPAFMFGGGFAVGTVAMDFFYPGRNFAADDLIRQVRFDNRIDDEWLKADWSVPVKAADITDIPDITINETPKPDELANNQWMNGQEADEGLAEEVFGDDIIGEAALVSLLGGSSINADTLYIIQEYSRNSRDLTEEIVPVPENFIGMDHLVFSQVIADFDKYPTLSEIKKGMIGCEVISFSPAKVVVRKTYDDLVEEIKPGYYLINENDLVTVYLGDLKTVFMNTSIEFKDLPAELQQEIMFTKYVEGEEELFGFLEAYSS